MIEICTGDILKAKAEALVNPVNCEGVMGIGLALQVKRAYPKVFEEYAAVCRRGGLYVGVVCPILTHTTRHPRMIINVPTKEHWLGDSRIEDVMVSIGMLVRTVRRLCLKSIAIPALGCGWGGLSWQVVQPMISTAFSGVSDDMHVMLYPPQNRKG